MSYINKYLRNFKPYKVASHAIWNVTAENRSNVLKLDWNEATVDPAPQVAERLHKLITDGSFLNLYPATNNDRLMELLSAYTGLDSKYIQYLPVQILWKSIFLSCSLRWGIRYCCYGRAMTILD